MNLVKSFKDFLAKYRDPKSPVTKLLTTSFAMVFASSLVMGYFISYYLSYQIQKNNAETTSSFVISYISEHINETDFKKNGANGRSEAYPKFDTVFSEMRNITKAARVQVLDSNGEIIWTDDKSIEWDRLKAKKIKKAFKNKIVYGFTKLVENKKLFFVFIPLFPKDSGRPAAVVEIYKDPHDISKAIYLGLMLIWLFVISSGSIIYYLFARAIKRSHQQNLVLQYELIEYSQELESNIQVIKDVQNVAILGLSSLAEYRDKETGMHLERMSLYSKHLAEELSNWDEFKFYISKNYVDSIYTSAALHDIGKVGIPDHVLLKPGKLDPDEWEIMKTHTTIGGDAIAAADKKLGIESFLTIGKEVAYFHHERMDGSGYPFGKAGEDIPLSARIVAIADVFDAIVSKRVYKPAIDFEKAKKIITDGSGTLFDTNIVKAFLKIEKTLLEILDKYKG